MCILHVIACNSSYDVIGRDENTMQCVQVFFSCFRNIVRNKLAP